MNKLRTWRKTAGLSIEEFALKLGISNASLSRIERGEQWPDRALFERIADATGGAVTPNHFLGLADDASASLLPAG